jgi:hypothetical protein
MPECRALELLAGSRRGENEELLALRHGFVRRMLAGLVRGGAATAQRKVVKAGGKPVKVSQIRITDAGRQVIEKRTVRNNDVGVDHRYFPNSPVHMGNTETKGQLEGSEGAAGGRDDGGRSGKDFASPPLAAARHGHMKARAGSRGTVRTANSAVVNVRAR